MRVLIVEDDEDFRRSLVDLLAKAGHVVEAAGDGPSALQLCERADVLITDIGIPGMDGLELLSRAKARWPSLAVLVMTGCDSPRSRSEACQRGAAAYLPKPFEKATLLGLLRCLEGRIEKLHEPVSALVLSRAMTRGLGVGARDRELEEDEEKNRRGCYVQENRKHWILRSSRRVSTDCGPDLPCGPGWSGLPSSPLRRRRRGSGASLPAFRAP